MASDQQAKQWRFRLNWSQRRLNPVNSLIPIVLVALVVLTLLAGLIAWPSLFYIYTPAILLFSWGGYSSTKPEAFEPHGTVEPYVVLFLDGALLYGAESRPVKVAPPLSIRKGLFGCCNIMIGPGRGLPIPNEVANCHIFIEACQRINANMPRN